jgi:hypothetical protein
VSGYVRIHRSLIGHPAFRNDAEAMAFAWLVAKAAWKPTRVRYKERAICLDRGQLAVSQRDMARALDRDKAWIERLWKRLRAEAMIEVGSEAGVAVITICKYVQYQASTATREAVDEAPEEAGARQGQGTEQGMEEVKIGSEAKASSPKRAKFTLPADIPAEPWAGYEEMRAKTGHRMTDRARQLAITELRKLADAGWPPGVVLNHCTLNSYRGIYPPKDRSNDRHQPSLRGNRPDPALDLYRAAIAEEQRENSPPDSGTRFALPAHGPS